MSERYDAVGVRKYQDRDGNEKTAFTNIGVAFPMKDRDGYSIRLHAIPAPVDGEYSILLFPPKPREEQEERKSAPTGRGAAVAPNARARQRPLTEELDDEIPF